MQDAETNCRLAGMDDYLTKPLNRAQLSQALERFLGPVKTADSPLSVDWDEFMAMVDGDKDFAHELVQLFIDSGDVALRDISKALGVGDLGAVERAAHSLKGSSANIRATSASTAAGRLEAAAKAGAAGEIPVLAQRLKAEAEHAAAFLRARLA